LGVTDGGADWNGINSPSFSMTNGTSYAVTVFAKYGTSNNIRVALRDNSAALESRVQGSPGSVSVTQESAGTISNVQEVDLAEKNNALVSNPLHLLAEIRDGAGNNSIVAMPLPSPTITQTQNQPATDAPTAIVTNDEGMESSRQACRDVR